MLDSFFVNFPYLARNTVINGNAAGMLGIGPKQPDFKLTAAGNNALRILITQQTQYHQYRIGIRTITNDWDSVYTMTGTLVDTIKGLARGVYDVSVMSDDTNGIESLPSKEYSTTVTGIGDIAGGPQGIELLQNKPNPFDFATYIGVKVDSPVDYQNAYIIVRDMKGQEVKRLPIKLTEGTDEVLFEHGYSVRGVYTYSLVIDGKQVESRSMIFAN